MVVYLPAWLVGLGCDGMGVLPVGMRQRSSVVTGMELLALLVGWWFVLTVTAKWWLVARRMQRCQRVRGSARYSDATCSSLTVCGTR